MAVATQDVVGIPEVAGVEHGFVEVQAADGPLRVHLAEAGDRGAEPLLLLHGWPQHWYCWRRLIEPLGQRFRLLMPDLRGFGWSEAPTDRRYDPPTFAADTVALLDELDIERVKLAGHDWAGVTAFVLGLGAPERIERMVVLNAPHPWIPTDWRAAASVWRTWYVVANALGASRFLADPKLLRTVLSAGSRGHVWSEADAHAYAERYTDPRRVAAATTLYRWYLRAAAGVLGRGLYRGQRLTVPTRLVFGADDAGIPAAWLAGGERHGDDFEIELVPGSGHFIQEERPDLVADRILKFLG